MWTPGEPSTLDPVVTARRRHTTVVHGAEQTSFVTFEEVASGEWRQVAIDTIKHPAPITIEESQRRYPDGRMVHPPPPQELPPSPTSADPIGDFQLKQAAIDRAKKDAAR